VTMRTVWFGFVLGVACSGGNDRNHPAPASGGSSAGGTHVTLPVGGSKTGDAGAAGESGGLGGASSGGAADGGAPEMLETAGAPPEAPPGVCAPDMTFGVDVAEDVGAESPTLLSMTSDELCVAFTTGSGDSLTLHVADRASTQPDFAQATVTLPDGFEAASGVSLSADGLQLILVMSDHSGFGQLERAARGQVFQGEADVTAFAKLNALKPMSGRSLGWPVVSADGNSLYFVSYFGQALAVQSRRGQDGVFDIGTEIDEFTLGGPAGEYKLLNGLASDERAIFYFDQATNHAMALFRSRPDAPFYNPLDLGARRGVVPNADCTRLYSSIDGQVVVQASK
jgi:hypothetical protein